MKIKNYKCKCGFDEFFFASKGNQIGIYCIRCGKWLKWADKDEQNLALKRIDNSILDKIRAEIESNMESIIGKYDSSIPKSNMPSYKIERNKVREECISIIDKYKDKGVEE